jgi:hypothetical protein
MPAKNPRVNVVLEKPLYDSVRRLAAKEEISLSLKIRDLIKEALEAQEDAALADFAEARGKTFRRSRGASHTQAWDSWIAHHSRKELKARLIEEYRSGRQESRRTSRDFTHVDKEDSPSWEC